MPRKASDPRIETSTIDDFVYRTVTQGWLGTPSYAVEVTVRHHPTGKSVLDTNNTTFESAHRVRQRALAKLMEAL